MEREPKKKRLLVIELNEFNLQLMQNLAEAQSMPNLKKILTFNKGITLTEDEYDSGYLEPWVQWVSVHTGVPSNVHKIKHLGDVPNLSFKQIWEKLSDKGYSSIVWGAMNASRGRADKCKYFLPDPWTFSEPGYPAEAAQLLEFPRYVAKNYLDIKLSVILKKLWRFVRVFDFSLFFSKEGSLELLRLIKGLFKYGAKNFIFISYFDFISAQFFLKLKKRFSPDVSFIFLNSLAHIQHHYWSPSSSKELIYGYKAMDRALGLILSDLGENEEVLILNALSQKNTNEEKPWVLYRQKDPVKFYLSLNLDIVNVEQLMTHDSHLHFKNQTDRDKAYLALCEVRIGNSRLFFCEKNPTDPNSLFIRLDFFDKITSDQVVKVNGVEFKFLQEFKAIVTRTAKHVQKGDVLTRTSVPPSKISNHLLYSYIEELVR